MIQSTQCMLSTADIMHGVANITHCIAHTLESPNQPMLDESFIQLFPNVAYRLGDFVDNFLVNNINTPIYRSK